MPRRGRQATGVVAERVSDGADHHPVVVARTAGNLNTEASGNWDGVEGFTALD
jgi:hypothetical protein